MSEKYFDQIEAYFEGKLSEDEKLLFERALKDDAGLKEAAEKYKLAKEAIDLLSDQEIRTKIKNWRTEDELLVSDKSKNEKQVSGVIKMVTRRYRLLAAVVLLLIVSIPVFRIFSGMNNSDKAFASLSEPLEVDRMRSGESEAWLKGIEAYQDADSELAIENLLEVAPVDDQVRYYLAHSYYLGNDFDAAEKLFRLIIELDESSYKEEAEWAWLASKYKLNEKDAAFDSLMSKITLDENHSFHDKAQEVKEKLEKE